MQQTGRLRLRPWLEEQIQSGRYPGVSWLDQSAQIFQIPWTHAARHGWSIDRDATLFRSWAMHTGRYRPGRDKPDPKTWKANFRCALNSIPDICELQEHSRKRGNNAFRVYRMLPSTQRHRRRRGLQSSKTKRRLDMDTMQSWPSAVAEVSPDTALGVDTPAEDIQTHGMWEVKPEEQEQEEAVYKLMDHLSNSDLWNQTGMERKWRTNTPWDHHCYCAADDNPYSLHPDYTDLFGSSHSKDFSDWSSNQQTLMS